MSNRTFIDRTLAGEVLNPEAELEALTTAWHHADEELPALHDWLGMTWDEYSLWVEKPSFLRAILMARASNIPLPVILRAAEPAASLAARGVPPEDIVAVRRWLKKTGRL